MKFLTSSTLLALASVALACGGDFDTYSRNLHLRHGAVKRAPSTVSNPPVPPLSSITYGMPTEATMPVTATYDVGATPPISGAPALPTPFVYMQGEWPAQDRVPPEDSPEVELWMQELEGLNIPALNPTINGSCSADPTSAADAANRGWWTCGGHTRPTDIVSCPQKYTWGVSFDDGPSAYTQTLLNYLDEVNVKSTLFVVGSRCIERPQVLREAYMAGHEIAVHTWSHFPLTSLTTRQIVAELGWSRKVIKQVTGVTPTNMRPPFGDIDDRVRAIALAMGLQPIIWTRTPAAGQFDTNDWRVAGGLVSGPDSFASFQHILGNATMIDTGFIVLQHDLYPISVDLARGYTLPAAMSFKPALTLKPIGECVGIPATNLYAETTKNATFPSQKTLSSIRTTSNNASHSGPWIGLLAASLLAIFVALS